ncbi:uncharacterized protein LOC110983021 [Acanthaster planci]|uniref:Uncharacterized protein LOC110983021 n=1 Tax=Acanthaster planci TaxID=133434 RepID=A0A8B7YW76_ACAPL|nr:uncharacterized protein LOC110983021 [Acanthaster planci]
MLSATDNVDILTLSDTHCADSAGNVVVSGGMYELGITTVTCSVTDAATNSGSCQFAIEVVDLEPPFMACSNPVPIATDIGRPDTAVTWTQLPSATDNVDMMTSSDIRCTNDAGFAMVSGGIYGVGTTTVTCSASDASMNTGSCQFIIEVVDRESPQISCPNAVTSESTDIGRADAAVSWTSMPSATDNVDVFTPRDILCLNEAGSAVISGGVYDLGITIVTCTATDAALNTDSCQFTVEVIDTEAPDISCPNSVISVIVDSGQSTVAVSWISMLSVSDNVDGLTLSDILCVGNAGNIVVSGGMYGLGTTTVTCSVTDAALNTGSCQFTVEVTENNNNGAIIAIAASSGVIVLGCLVAIASICVCLMRRVPGHGLYDVQNSFSNKNVEWEERPEGYRRSAKHDIRFHGQQNDIFPRPYIVPGPEFVRRTDENFNDAFYY